MIVVTDLKKRPNNTVLFIIACICFVIGSITFSLAKPNKYQRYITVPEDTKLAGSHKFIEEETQAGSLKFFHYPTFDQEKIDHKILEIVQSFPTEEGINFLNYESTYIQESYVSIQFAYQQFTMEEELLKEEKRYVNFQLKTGKELQLEDVFRRNYSNLLKSEARKQVDVELPSTQGLSFQLFEDRIVIYLEDEKCITLTFEEYKQMLKLPEFHPTTPSFEIERSIHIDPDKPMVALTFDDGPSTYTMDFMNVFTQHGGTATFFMLGKNVIRFPEVVEHMYKQGFEIANHSWDHESVASDDMDFIKKEIYDTQDALFNIVGNEPSLFRPPYGAYNTLTKEVAGDIFVTLWNIDTLDWRHRNTDIMVGKVREQIHDGAMVLFHDLYPSSLEAVKILVPELLEQGYQLVSASDLLKYKGEKTGL